MDRQVSSRLIILGAVITMVLLAASSDVSRILILAVAIPAAFVAAGVSLLLLPYIAVQKADGREVGAKKFLDFAEHGTIFAWLDLFALWLTSGIAFMGLTGAPLAYSAAFGVAFVVGLGASLNDLYLSEASDDVQSLFQHHPQ